MDKKTDSADTLADVEDKAAIAKVMKDAIAARHGGVLPQTMSEEDIKASIAAAHKWKKLSKPNES